MTLIGYDPDRVRVLRRTAGRAVEQLGGLRSDDPAASSSMAVVRAVKEGLDGTCLPLADRVLICDAMLTFNTVGLVPIVGKAVLEAGRGTGAVLSSTDTMLVQLLHQFQALDLDGDGALSADELAVGRIHDDADVRVACEHVLSHPSTMVNVAIAASGVTVHGDGDDLVHRVSITPTAISHALAQNRVLRVLAEPATFARLDRELTGQIDGLVSADDVRARLVHEDDPQLRGELELMLAVGLLGRIDRDGLFADSDGTIAYDQVYALGVHQGAFDGLPDPAIPSALRQLYDGLPELTGDRTPQFLHHDITPQPGLGQVVMALYIPAPTVGVGDWKPLHSTGNDRRANPRAHPSDSKGWAVVDYETGLVTVRVNPSCSGTDAGACSDPLPIVTDFGGWANVFQRIPLVVDDSNRVRIVDGGRTRIRFGIVNSDKQTIAPQLDAELHVAANDDGTVDLEWDRNPFPALEAYHIYHDGRIVPLADEPVVTDPATGLAWGSRTGAGRG